MGHRIREDSETGLGCHITALSLGDYDLAVTKLGFEVVLAHRNAVQSFWEILISESQSRSSKF